MRRAAVILDDGVKIVPVCANKIGQIIHSLVLFQRWFYVVKLKKTIIGVFIYNKQYT